MDAKSCPGCGVGDGIPHFSSCYLHYCPMETHMVDRQAQSQQVGGSHYQTQGIQPIDFIMSNDIPFAEGSVIKYTFRHAKKNGAQDIRKAIHYLQFILENTYGETL